MPFVLRFKIDQVTDPIEPQSPGGLLSLYIARFPVSFFTLPSSLYRSLYYYVRTKSGQNQEVPDGQREKTQLSIKSRGLMTPVFINH